MKTNVIKVLVLFQMSVREVKGLVKSKELPKKVLKDSDLLMELLMIKNHASA